MGAQSHGAAGVTLLFVGVDGNLNVLNCLSYVRGRLSRVLQQGSRECIFNDPERFIRDLGVL